MYYNFSKWPQFFIETCLKLLLNSHNPRYLIPSMKGGTANTKDIKVFATKTDSGKGKLLTYKTTESETRRLRVVKIKSYLGSRVG